MKSERPVTRPSLPRCVPIPNAILFGVLLEEQPLRAPVLALMDQA